MSNTDKLMQSFLIKLNSVEIQEAFEILDVILENLEEKNDPEPFEMHFVNEAYQFVEKINLIKGILKDRLVESEILEGDKLQNLYDKTKPMGSGVLFANNSNKKE